MEDARGFLASWIWKDTIYHALGWKVILNTIPCIQSHHENDEKVILQCRINVSPLLFRTLPDLFAKWRGHQVKGLVKARDIEIALLDEK
jgi:hypothetical protein